MKKKFEKEIKDRIQIMTSHGFRGERFVISLGGSKDILFERVDIVNAIFRVGKIKTKGSRR